MNTLRRPVRNAIEQSTAVFAIVEDIHLGLATVRIGNNGARMTNLSVMGGTVTIGQRVIVDYSSGARPIVRPIFPVPPEEEATQLETSAPGNGPSEKPGTIYDIGGCFVFEFETWEPYDLVLERGKDFDLRFGAINKRWNTHGNHWNSGISQSKIMPWGDDHITIQRTGKYLITVVLNMQFWSAPPVGGHERVRIFAENQARGSRYLGEVRIRDYNGEDNRAGINSIIFANLYRQDSIYMKIMYTHNVAEYAITQQTGTQSYNTHSLMLQMVPNTLDYTNYAQYSINAYTNGSANSLSSLAAFVEGS